MENYTAWEAMMRADRWFPYWLVFFIFIRRKVLLTTLLLQLLLKKRSQGLTALNMR
jgi:hypothetical protein